MLNLYDCYEPPEQLPLYNELHSRIELFSMFIPDEYGVVPLDDMGEAPEGYTSEDYKHIVHLLQRDAGASYYYALYVLKGRFKEGEPTIMKDGLYAVFYAKDVLANDPSWPHKNGQWPEAEPVIMQDSRFAYKYAKEILHRRWPEAEPIIMQQIWTRKAYKEMFGLE